MPAKKRSNKAHKEKVPSSEELQDVDLNTTEEVQSSSTSVSSKAAGKGKTATSAPHKRSKAAGQNEDAEHVSSEISDARHQKAHPDTLNAVEVTEDVKITEKKDEIIVEVKKKQVASSLASNRHRLPVELRNIPRFYQAAMYRPYSVLDSPEWTNSKFFGFYVLFWVAISVSMLRILLLNVFKNGYPLGRNVIATLQRDWWHVGLADLVMYIAMYPTFFMQYAVSKKWVNWKRYGWILQHLYQSAYLVTFVLYARARSFTWIAQIFLTLHCLVQIMKMHSFAVFNGYMFYLKEALENPKIVEKLDKQDLEQYTEQLGKYPKNLTLHNFFMYTMYPTCVYELEYPRTEKIRWGFVFRQVVATLGIFMCMTIIAEQSMHPIAVQASELREHGSLLTRIKGYPLIFMEVYAPFMLLYILTFYIIWHSIMNGIAELSRYGDREFYRDWWNSTEWAKFARDWNVPVHNFLQRHVYTSSRLQLQLSKGSAMFFTFLLSSVVHELAMWVIFGRLRGFLFGLQLMQLPMQLLSNLKFFKSRPTLGLVTFWFGIALGPSILCSLYLTF
ncbi:sterol acyltransferase [Starmerella bacillaris]|mgnify:CR=1 FL=1|uniref:O-acyltransferase n=1 Tax=Starmerella bacillaris TaxID=1247836 RepID=A0AAV5RKT8_STABA|nr:sterol acyltransferase [Starmerella bacillaris]